MSFRIITIDGPAGAGKSTVSRALSKKLGCIYVDTGALYRGVAYEIMHQQVDWEDDELLKIFLKQLDLNFIMKNDELVLMSSGKDISGKIRTSRISMLASASSAKPIVRSALLGIQQNIAKSQDAVFEGRDMGTVVFPQASYKFFLFADLSVRAKRRYDELSGKLSDESTDIGQIQMEMQKRDTNDSQRQSAPLKKADDAIEIDSTLLSIAQVVEKMFQIIVKA
ncbi:MAG: (d)CMP kinase [Pseudomonadota bacterium]